MNEESMIRFLNEDTVFYEPEPGATTATFDQTSIKQMQDEKGL